MKTSVYSFRGNLAPGITGSGYVKSIEGENNLLWIGVTFLSIGLLSTALIAYTMHQKVKQQFSGSGIHLHPETQDAYLRRA